MSYKKMWIILSIIIPIGLIIIYFVSRPVTPKVTEQSSISPTPTIFKPTLATWTDEAGFSFQYPQDISVDKHPEDTTNYANLTFTENGKEGSITVVMSDIIKNNRDDWTIDTTLGGKEGKKNITSTETIIEVIDNDVLVTLKKTAQLSPLLETAWQNITDTWEFIYPTPKATKTTQTTTSVDTGGDILEEE